MDTDAMLDRAGAGDTLARDQLLAQHRERLKQMIRFRLDPRLAARIDSSDVVQETLASAAQRLEQYLQLRPLPFYPWLRQIAWDKLVELHRFHFRHKRSVAREQPIDMRLSDQSVSQLANLLAASQSSPSARIARTELAERIGKALGRLPIAEREILTLRHLEQLDTTETAAVLGISESATKSRHFRAMQRLLRDLDECEKRDLTMNQRAVRDDMTDAVLIDVLDELTARFNAGESFDLAAYERRLPEHVDQIRKLAATLEAMAQFSQSPQASEKPEGAPKQLGDFRIVREIGRGGMGVVYEAEQISLGRPVALKVLPYAALMDERAIQRFRNEARAAALLDHPNIVPVHAVSAERGVHFYAMSLITGLTLAEVIAEMRSRIREIDGADLSVQHIVSDNSGNLGEASQDKASGYEPTLDRPTKTGEERQEEADFVVDTPSQLETRREVQAAISTHRGDFDTEYFRKAAQIGVEAAEALDHAHQHGILHRDVKPGNLMVDGSGKTWITDFGLARIGTDAGMTATGDLIGTVRYMAPEQALAKRVTIDHRADIYSLGVTLYELLTLQPAFDAPDREALLKQIAFEEPRAPRRLNPAIPRELEVIVLKAMAKHPNDRFETAQEVADDLRRFLDDEPIRAKPPTLAQRATRFARRHKPLVASAVIILLLTTVGLAVGNVLIAQQRNRAEKATTEAKQQTEIAQQNFQRARDAVDKYLTMVSESQLLEKPGLQPLREDLLKLALKYYREFAAERIDDRGLQSDLADAYHRVAAITYELGSFKESKIAQKNAQKIREQLVAKHPNVAEHKHWLAVSLQCLALLLAREGNAQEAGKHLKRGIDIEERLVANDPNSCEYKHHLAVCHHHLGTLQRRTNDLDRAIKSHQKAIEIWEELSKTSEELEYRRCLAAGLSDLGMALRDSSKTKDAIVATKKAIEVNEAIPRDSRSAKQINWLATHYNNLSVLQFTSGRGDDGQISIKKAITLLEEASAKNPEVASFQESLARAYVNLGTSKSGSDPEEASTSFQAAIQILKRLFDENPNDAEYQRLMADIHRNNAIVNDRLGKTREAFKEFSEAIRLSPQFADGHDYVAWHLATSEDEQFRQPEKAVTHALKAVELVPESHVFRNTLGVAYYLNGQWGEAIAALTKSMELADGGGDASDFYFLAMAHWQRGDEEEAHQWYKKGATWTWDHVPDRTMLRYVNEAAALLRRPPPPVCEVLLLPHEPLFSHRPFFDAEHLLKLLHAQSRLGPDDTFHQELALAGFRSQLRIVNPEWALGRIVMLPKAVSAHYNPRDGRLYVGRRRPEGNEPEGQWKFLGGLYCIEADGSAQEVLATDRIAGVAVDHGTGDVYFSEDRLGKIRRIAFGKTQPEDWVSHFPQGNTFPVGLAIADADSLPGQGFVVNHGALHQRDELHRFSTIDPEDVVAFHSDAPDDGPLAAPLDVAIRNDEVFVADPTMGIFQLEAEGSLQPVELRERLMPKGIAVDPATGNLVVVDAAKRRLVTVDTTTGEVTNLATGLVCHYWGSAGIDVTPDGKQLFYTEYNSGLIVTLTRKTGGNSPFEEGLAHAARHEWDRAVSRFTEAIEQNPACAVAYSERGFAYAELKKLDLAASDWGTAATIDPAVSLHYCYRGEVFREEGQLIRALAEYDKALQLDPELAQAHAGRGCVRLEQQEIGEAIASLTRAIELDPLHAISYAERGFAFQIKQELDRANDDWKMAQQLKDDCSAHFLSQGEVRAAMSRWEQAANSYSKAIQFDPANHKLYAKRAEAWTRCEQWAKAEQDLLKVIELGSPQARYWRALGLVRLARGDVEAYRRGCSELFERYSDAEPLVIPHWKLAWCCEPYPPSEDVLQQALLYAERAKPIPANVRRANGAFLSLLLWAGRFEEKAKTIEEDFVWAPGSEWKGLRLAIYHAKAGRREEAHSYLKRTKPLVEEGQKTRRGSTYVELQLRLLMRMAEDLIEQQDGKLKTTE